MNRSCVDVKYSWTPEQADAIVEYLDRLRDVVWEYYGDEILELHQNDPNPDEHQEVMDFSEDIDF